MTERRRLDVQIAGLGDIAKIARSMKNLSLMEARKLERFLQSQHRVVASIEEVARDFLDFHPGLLRPPTTMAGAWLLIGAERGFCAGFNEAVLREWRARLPAHLRDPRRLIALGAKLGAALEPGERPPLVLEGATTAEEVPAVLAKLVEAIGALEDAHGPLGLRVLYHEVAGAAVQAVEVLPPFRAPAGASPPCGVAPLLYMPPRRFLQALAEQHLFAVLHRLLYSSLAVEHQQRVRHLQGAIERLGERVAALEVRRNRLRQEEITEEIELILLNAGDAGRA